MSKIKMFCTTLFLMLFIICIMPVFSETVKFQNGENIQGIEYQGVKDASIWTRTPNKPIYTLLVERWYYEGRGLISFDLSLLKSMINININRAILSLYIESYPGLHDQLKSEGKMTLGIFIVNKNWDEKKVTWNKYDGSNNWDSAGGDFDKEPIATTTINTVNAITKTWIDFDVTSWVRGFVNGLYDHQKGLLVRAITRIYPELYFTYSESNTSTITPKLIVEYISPYPVANAGADQEVGINAKVILDGTKSYDPSDSPEDLIYSWHFISKPKMSNLKDNDIYPNNTSGNKGGANPFFITDAVGKYQIELTVKNSKGLSSKDNVLITSFHIKHEHPRIWITPERLTILKTKAKTGSADWLDFKKSVDTYGGFYNWALAYIVTEDDIYATKAIESMWEAYNFDLPSGQPGYWGSYFARLYPPILSIAYDWLYDKLTLSERNMVWQKLNEWADFYFYGTSKEANWALNDPHNNFFYGRILGGGLTALATYGDNPRAKEWYDLVRYEKYQNIARPQFLSYYKEGSWLFEGSDYSPASYSFLLQYFWALKTATGEDLFKDTEFPEALIYNIIYNTLPSRDRILPTGDWTGWTSLGWLKDSLYHLSLLLAPAFKGSTSSEYIQWYINNAKFSLKSESLYKWMKFLWYDETAPERNINDLPLYYFEPGTGFVSMRSDWSENATWIAFQCGGYPGNTPNHAHLDQGSFYIYKNSWLVAPANVAAGRFVGSSSLNYNVISISDGTEEIGQHSRPSDKAIIEKFGSGNNYFYIQGELADRYNSYHSNLYIIETYKRTLVSFMPDCTIILDRIKTKDPKYYPKSHLKTVNEPNTESSLLTIMDGKGKALIKILEPENFDVEKFLSNGWSTRIVPKVKQQEQTFLQAIYISNSDDNVIPQITKMDNDSIIGVQIFNKIAIFSKKGIPINEFHYNVNGQGITENIIMDMLPNKSYFIYLDDILVQDVQSDKNGTVTFNIEIIGSHQIFVSESNNKPLGKPGKPLHIDK